MRGGAAVSSTLFGSSLVGNKNEKVRGDRRFHASSLCASPKPMALSRSMLKTYPRLINRSRSVMVLANPSPEVPASRYTRTGRFVAGGAGNGMQTWNEDEKQPIFVNTLDQSQAMYAEINPPSDEPSAPVLSASVSVR